MNVCIALLATLCYLKSLLNHFDLVGGHLNNLWPQNLSFSNFGITYERSTFPSIERFIGCHSNACMKVVVVGELHKWQVCFSISFGSQIRLAVTYPLESGWSFLTVHPFVDGKRR